MTYAHEAQGWAAQLDALVARIAPRFRCIEPRRRARAYLQGLLSPLERKNGWHLAEAAGDASPACDWDADAVREDLRAYVVEQLGDCPDPGPFHCGIPQNELVNQERPFMALLRRKRLVRFGGHEPTFVGRTEGERL